MRTLLTGPMIAIAILAALPTAVAQATAPNPAPGPQDKRVNLNVHDMRLRAAVDMLFQGTGLNVAVEPAVPDVPITLSVMDQPFKTALRMLIRIAAAHIPGLTFTQDMGLYLIKIREARAP